MTPISRPAATTLRRNGRVCAIDRRMLGCAWVIAKPKTLLHQSAAMPVTDAAATASNSSVRLDPRSGTLCRPCRCRSHMVTHTHVAGTSSISSNRQLESSRPIPRTTRTSIPAIQATGAR